MSKVAIIAGLIFLYSQAFSQPSKLVFDHYNTQTGFNSREAKSIATTANGLVWITSNDGLVRYDTKRFKFYQHSVTDSSSLTYNYCGAIIKDRREWLWLVSHMELEVFDPATEKFSHIKLQTANGIKEPVWPRSFYYDSANDIMWVATRQGLFYAKQGQLKLEQPLVVQTNKKLQKGISSITGDGNILWVTTDSVIYKIDSKSNTVASFQLPVIVNNIINKPAARYTCSYLDKNKVLWLGTWGNGLVAFNTVTHSFEQYVYSDYKRYQNAVISIAQTGIADQQDILWLSTTGIGFAAFNTVTKSFRSYQNNFLNDISGIKGNTYGIHTATGRGMWIGSENGLHYYDFTRQMFSSYDLSDVLGKFQNLPISDIAFEKGKNGSDEKIWFHVPYMATYTYNIQKGAVQKIPPGFPSYTGAEDGIRSFFIDSKNILWASNKHGLTAYDINSGKPIIKETPKFMGKGQWAADFFEKNGTIWISTFDGLFAVNNSNFKIAEIEKVNNLLKAEKLSTSITGLAADEKNNIWFVTGYTDKPLSAIVCYNTVSGTVKIVYKESDTYKPGKPLHEFIDITYSTGKVFIGDRMNGIWYFNTAEEKPEMQLLSQKNGLSNTRLNRLLTDKKGDIWCHNDIGMACYKIKDGSFNNYPFNAYELNSLPEAMAISAGSGKIFLGYQSSIEFIDPAVTDTLINPEIIFTAINLFNNPYISSGTRLNNGSSFNFLYNENSIAVEFALPSYSNSFNNRYSWKLEGLEKTWTISTDNIAAYTNLQPGTYTLHVKAANSKGIWSAEKYLKFIISPPFYKRWWFITLCLLAIVAVVYYIVQLRINRIKERHRLRTKLASDLHDEIGSTLTSINILSNVSQQALEKQPGQAKEMLQQISEQSKNIQQSMSDIVWSIRPDNEKIENLVVRMREYAAQTLEPLDIKVTIHTDESVVNKVLPMECRKDILLIYKEAINNIAKHAGAKIVTVSLSNGNKQIELSIHDNGSWKGDNSGTGTKSMKERASANGGNLIISLTDKGTTVTATIPIP